MNMDIVNNIKETLFSQLSFRAKRQEVISSNIANINTPNYKTKELVFKDVLEVSPILKLSQTNSKHIGSISSVSMMDNTKIIEPKGLEEQNDGNNVSLDVQMSDMSKNKIMFDAIQSAIKKNGALLKAVVESSSKN